MSLELKALPGEKAYIVDYGLNKIFDMTVFKIVIEKPTKSFNGISYYFNNYDKKLPDELVFKTSIDAEKSLNIYLLQQLTFKGKKILEVVE